MLDLFFHLKDFTGNYKQASGQYIFLKPFTRGMFSWPVGIASPFVVIWNHTRRECDCLPRWGVLKHFPEGHHWPNAGRFLDHWRFEGLDMKGPCPPGTFFSPCCPQTNWHFLQRWTKWPVWFFAAIQSTMDGVELTVRFSWEVDLIPALIIQKHWGSLSFPRQMGMACG